MSHPDGLSLEGTPIPKSKLESPASITPESEKKIAKGPDEVLTWIVIVSLPEAMKLLGKSTLPLKFVAVSKVILTLLLVPEYRVPVGNETTPTVSFHAPLVVIPKSKQTRCWLAN